MSDATTSAAKASKKRATGHEPQRLPDAAARNRIRTELTRSLLVEAGAGSGKTHELATRMAAGIAGGVYQLERMAAVTFTRKAAAELRGRFQLALEAQLKGSDGESAERLRQALGNIERFFAGTIHSFCARLLRERPVEAGVAPGFTELDDAEDKLLRQESWRDFRSQAVADGDPDFLLLDDAGIKPKQLDEAFRTVCLHEEVDFPPGHVTMPDDTYAWKAFETFWAELDARIPAAVPPEAKCKFLAKAIDFRRHWTFTRRQQRSPTMVAELLTFWDSKTEVTGKWWALDGSSADKSRAKAEIGQLRDDFRDTTVTPFLTAWREYLYGIAVRVLVKARARAAVDRQRRNVLSFNDLLGRTAEVLRARPDVRRAMQQKYAWLFVDEFQDTDPLQAEIMFLLAGEDHLSSDVNWHTTTLRPGALFVVGDPKQSIYRFTRADIDIYNQVRARLAGPDGQGVVTLTSNFRSLPGLCEWANQVFDGMFPKEVSSQSPMYAPLRAARTAADEPDARFCTLTIPDDADDGVGEEAERIARYIRSEVDAGRRSCGDFLVLTRKKKNLQAYADALERRRLPVEVSGGSGFSESEDVRQFALLLLALTDPQDQVALVGVLRGALFGLSDRQLFAWKQGGGTFSVFAGPDEATGDPVGAALSRLRRWHGWARVLPAGAALERILDDSGYVALAASNAGGVDAGDLLHAVDRVRAVVETGFTLFEAAAALASWSELDEDGPEESTEVESLPLEPGRPDVARVMNLHKAKGLEAPVVFLADPAGGYPSRVNVRITRDPRSGAPPLGYFQIREPWKNGRPGKPIAQPVGWDQLHDEEKVYLDAEQTRLLYVAATRAKDMLAVSRRTKSGASPAWAALEPHLAGFTELPVPAVVQEVVPESVDLTPAAAAKADRAIELAHGAAVKASWAATSVTAESKGFPTITPAGQDDVLPDDPTRVMTEDTPSRRADAGMAWGALVHGLLEHSMRFPRSTRDDLRRLARWLTVEEPSLAAVIEQAIDTVEAVAASERLKAARSSSEHHEEAPFSVLVRRAGELPTVISGTIDLVYRDGETWCVVDYKTDVDGGAALAGKYAAQVAAYRSAWGTVSGGSPAAEIVAARKA